MSFTPETLLRHWQTLRLIPRHPRRTTAGELREHLAAAGFQVGKRTVERDLQMLSRLFPLVSEESTKPYSWSWQQDVPAFDVPGVSAGEALTLLMAREHLRLALPASTLAQMQPYFRMAEQKLAGSEPSGARLRNWLSQVRVIPPAQPLCPPGIDANVQSVIQEALILRRQCRVGYLRKGADTPESYPAHPLGLVQRGTLLYLVCTVREYQDVRLLALHRIRSAELLASAAERPHGFDLDVYISGGAFGWGPGQPIHLEAAFTPQAGSHLEETPLAGDQTLDTLPDGRLRITAGVLLTQQLEWWLLGFGDAVEVLAPPALRARMAARLREAARRYDSPGTEN